MRCLVCNSTDKWKNIDHVRLKPHGMCMCMGCAFVSYPKKYQTQEEIKAHYRSDYRKAPNVQHTYSGERKLHYHHSFLGEMFEQWREAGREPVIGEIGSAFGMLLDWIKKFHFPNGDISGTEWGLGNRMVAREEYGLELTDDLDWSKKYDLLISYHVLEHMMDADKALEQYSAALKDDGFLYLSCPIWFRDAANSGQIGFDLEYHWAPDHINCWSEQHLEYLFAKANLEIVKKNDKTYGNTYLLKRSQKALTPAIDTWTPDALLATCQNLHDAWQALQSNETAVAIEKHPNYPTAWAQHYELMRAPMHKQGWPAIHAFLNQAVAACKNTGDTLVFAADIASRYNQFDYAIDYFARALEIKPNSPNILIGLANVHRQKSMLTKDPAEKNACLRECIKILRHVRATSMELAPQAVTWLFRDEANLNYDGAVKVDKVSDGEE